MRCALRFACCLSRLVMCYLRLLFVVRGVVRVCLLSFVEVCRSLYVGCRVLIVVC